MGKSKVCTVLGHARFYDLVDPMHKRCMNIIVSKGHSTKHIVKISFKHSFLVQSGKICFEEQL